VGSDQLTGRTLGHHVILERLGEGGMGVVYKARDDRLSRLVALKVMRQDWMADAERKRRFVREAQAASALNHPNIVTIYAIDTDCGVDFIAMEYLGGGTLADVIASGPLPAERALRLAGQVADALTAAHEAGIVHRDLKPSNIMVSAQDRVKVVDFGLAKLVEPWAHSAETANAVTAAGTIVGTAAYMSPEQAAGQSVDARSDLFSLGSILYEMLTGRRPFGGSTAMDVLAAVLRDDPAPMSTVAPEVARLVERCLRKDVTQRCQSAAELKAAIEGCLTHPVSPDRPGVAVLPLANMSGEREDDYLCEGLAEEIINALTRIPGLRVIARTSAFAAARLGLDAREIGARLGVGSILEGSVRRAGRRVRVTAQLISTRDGTHLWSDRYDRELTDVLLLEDEIAAAIAARLRVELGRKGQEPPQPVVNVEAHQAYLEGRYHFAKGTPAALAQAKALFERAIEQDPKFALGYDSLAELYWYLGFFGGVPPREAFSVSTWHALRALELDDTLAETHALLGMLRKELDYNWREVDRELRRALELNGASPLVRLRYAICGPMPHGRAAEAMSEVERVVQVDPLSVFSRWWLGTMAYLARQPERAIDEGRHMIELDPNHFLGHWTLGVGLEATGAKAQAVAALERADELSGGTPFTRGFLAYACGRAGRRDAARALFERAEQLAASTYVPPFTIALAHIGLESWEAAFEWMNRAIEVRDPLIMPIKNYLFLDPVRQDARFAAMLRAMNLEP